MHPILADPRRLALYLLAWIPVGALFTALTSLTPEIPWTGTALVWVPMAGLYAFVSLSPWQLCRVFPLSTTPWSRVRNAIDQHELYVFDLEQKRLLRKVAYEGRPRTSLKVSTDGETVYVHHAGNTIDYHDAETFAFEKRVELPGDSTAHIIVVP